MIWGLGIDLTEIERIHHIRQKGDAFARKILTANELAVYQKLSSKRQDEFLAGRFSAKESYSKALGTGIGKAVNFKDLEIIDNELGKPELRRHPKQNELKAFVSISHTAELVMTEVILEKKD